jgi:hypothetical protein
MTLYAINRFAMMIVLIIVSATYVSYSDFHPGLAMICGQVMIILIHYITPRILNEDYKRSIIKIDKEHDDF